MNKIRVKEIVIGAFEKYSGQHGIDANHHLFTDIEVDSLDIAEIIMKIEDSLDISVDSDILDNCKTIQDIIDIFFDLVKDK